MHPVNHGRKGNVIGTQLVGIKPHLVLADEAADRRHLGDARNGFKLVAQEPVLQAAQVSQAVLMALIDDQVFVHPPSARRIRSDDGMNARRQASGDLLHVLEDPGSRPIEVGTVLEDDEDVGITEHRLRPHRFHVRGGQKRGDDRIGDLVFDDVGWFALPRRMNDHLDVGDVRQRIERDAPERPDPSQHQQEGSGEDQEAVAGAPVNPAGNHVTFPLRRSRSVCLFATVCPFF